MMTDSNSARPVQPRAAVPYFDSAFDRGGGGIKCCPLSWGCREFRCACGVHGVGGAVLVVGGRRPASGRQKSTEVRPQTCPGRSIDLR